MGLDVSIFKLRAVASNLQLGKRGPRVRDDGSGVIQARNAADDALARFQVATPTADDDAATKAYVDGVASGLDLKGSVRAKTAGTELNAWSTWIAAGAGAGATLSSPDNLVGNNDVDGVTLIVGDRVLVTQVGGDDVTPAADNGIYEVTQVATGAAPTILERTTDADQDAEVTAGMFCFVEEGAAHQDEGWVLVTNDPITVDTTALQFSQFSDTGQQDPLFRQDVVDFNDTFPLSIGTVLPSGAIPIRTYFEVTTFWDDAATELDVESDGAQQYMSEDENDLGPSASSQGLYESTHPSAVAIDGTGQVRVGEVTAGTPTQGQALVTVEYLLPA